MLTYTLSEFYLNTNREFGKTKRKRKTLKREISEAKNSWCFRVKVK